MYVHVCVRVSGDMLTMKFPTNKDDKRIRHHLLQMLPTIDTPFFHHQVAR